MKPRTAARIFIYAWPKSILRPIAWTISWKDEFTITGSKKGSPTALAPGKPPVSSKTTQGPEAPSVGIVRLKDVAHVEMGATNYNTSCLLDGKPSVGLSVYQLPRPTPWTSPTASATG